MDAFPKTSNIMSKKKLMFMRVMVLAGRGEYIHVNEPTLSYRAVMWRNRLYFI